jgi:hypothetical protein
MSNLSLKEKQILIKNTVKMLYLQGNKLMYLAQFVARMYQLLGIKITTLYCNQLNKQHDFLHQKEVKFFGTLKPEEKELKTRMDIMANDMAHDVVENFYNIEVRESHVAIELVKP